MTDRDRLRWQLMRHEGVRLSAYQDARGFWTIGVGRLIDARREGGITEAEAEYLLSGDIDRVTRGLVAQYPTWFPDLDPVRQAALVNMAFNLGLSGLATFTHLLAALARKQYGLASDEMVASRWAIQVGDRAVELSAQMKTGQWQR